MKKIISIAQFTRYYLSDGIFYSDWLSIEKILSILGRQKIKITMFAAYYPDETPISAAEFIKGKRVSHGMRPLANRWVPAAKLKRLIDEHQLQTNDFEFQTKGTMGNFTYESGFVGEARVLFPPDKENIVPALLLKLDTPKNLYKILHANKGAMVKVNTDGTIHSVEKIDFKDYWENYDFFQRFPEVQGKK